MSVNNPADIVVIGNTLDDLHAQFEHEAHLFPEDTDETVTFTAGGSTNTFGSWAEIVDNSAVKLSSKFNTEDMHIEGIVITSTNTADKRWILEFAWGAAKTPAGRMAFGSGTKKVHPEQAVHLVAEKLPLDELIYYRLKCETASATCTVSLTYYHHSTAIT